MRRLILPVIIAMVFVASHMAKTRFSNDRAVSEGQMPAGRPTRIVSLAPSITETLFALGLSESVIGVTDYCRYPAEARLKQKIGGYHDPNYEVIMALEPDLLIVLTEQADIREFAARLGIRTLTVDHQKLEGIIESIPAIGGLCEAGEIAEKMVADIRSRLDSIRNRTHSLPRPRVLVSIGSDSGSATLTGVYIAGQDGFYNEMLNLAGGANVYERRGIAFPTISAEGIITLNPDVIIDIAPYIDDQKLTVADVKAKWDTLPQVDAVRNDRVHVLTDDYNVIPGPRFVQAVEAIARSLHPDVNWD